MIELIERLATLWVGRRAKPEPAALAAIRDLEPATLITGASRGIGLALANRFAKAGHTVVLVGRTTDTAEWAAQSIANTYGVRAYALPLDVTSPNGAETIDAFLAGKALYLDTLVNNAGIGLAGAFTEHAPDDIDRLLALNVDALTRLTHHALRLMLPRGRGGILNVASMGAHVPGPYQAAYYASKSYVLSLTEAIAEENVGSGVRITAVSPGPVPTDFHADMKGTPAPYLHLIPQKSPERVAGAAYRAYVLGCRAVVPGLLTPLLAYAGRILPRRVSSFIMAFLLKPRR